MAVTEIEIEIEDTAVAERMIMAVGRDTTMVMQMTRAANEGISLSRPFRFGWVFRFSISSSLRKGKKSTIILARVSFSNGKPLYNNLVEPSPRIDTPGFMWPWPPNLMKVWKLSQEVLSAQLQSSAFLDLLGRAHSTRIKGVVSMYRLLSNYPSLSVGM